MARNSFGELLKRLRLARGVTLRDFCMQNAFDPGNYSRMERGLLPPPKKGELLEKYAVALGVAPGTDAWLEFFDTAAAVQGRVPPDILADDQLAQKLPLLFRTIRSQPLSPEKLDEFAEQLRKS